MVDAAKTSKTSVYVGNSDYLVALAEDGGDDRWVRSMSLAGAAAIDRIPTLGSQGVESIVNQESATLSAQILYGGDSSSGPKALRPRQDDTDNMMVIVGTDALACYVLPVTWTGQPIDNPTSSLITTNMEFLLRAVGVDGTPTAGKTRAKKFTDHAGGTETSGFYSANPGDLIWLVVTAFEGTTQNFNLEASPGGTALSDDVSVGNAGIYPVPVKAGQSWADGMALAYAGASSDKISGWLLSGVEMTIDGG